jgi:hypothetical protein
MATHGIQKFRNRLTALIFSPFSPSKVFRAEMAGRELTEQVVLHVHDDYVTRQAQHLRLRKQVAD